MSSKKLCNWVRLTGVESAIPQLLDEITVQALEKWNACILVLRWAIKITFHTSESIIVLNWRFTYVNISGEQKTGIVTTKYITGSPIIEREWILNEMQNGGQS